MGEKGKNMATNKPATPAANANLKAAATYVLGFITGIVFLVVEKEDKFVRFHAMQSTVVFGALFILGFVPVIGAVLGLIIAPLTFILWLVLMYKAYSGEKFKLPVVGDFAEKQLEKFK